MLCQYSNPNSLAHNIIQGKSGMHNLGLRHIVIQYLLTQHISRFLNVSDNYSPRQSGCTVNVFITTIIFVCANCKYNHLQNMKLPCRISQLVMLTDTRQFHGNEFNPVLSKRCEGTHTTEVCVITHHTNPNVVDISNSYVKQSNEM